MQSKKFFSLAALTPALLLVLVPSFGVAEIRNCKGVITNQECSGGEKIADEKPLRTLSPETDNTRKKESLLSGLRTVALKAKGQYGVEVDPQVTEAVCKISTVEECGKLVVTKEQEITALVASSKLAKERRAERDALLQETRVGSDSPEQGIDKSRSVITVIQNKILQNNINNNSGIQSHIPIASPITGVQSNQQIFPTAQPPVSPKSTIITRSGKALEGNSSKSTL
jgi:hypothetical protein